MPRILGPAFYRRDTRTVARELLGATLVHVVEGRRISGRIVETEAYLGIDDRACHTYGDRRTDRTRSMYLVGGHAYVYFIYGMHFCFNVVTRTTQHPEAVLIRALEPLEGIELMRERRAAGSKSGKAPRDLAGGPGKLCQALGIDRGCDGMSLLGGSELFIERGPRIDDDLVTVGPRVGVDYAGEAAGWPLRWKVHTLNTSSSQVKRRR